MKRSRRRHDRPTFRALAVVLLTLAACPSRLHAQQLDILVIGTSRSYSSDQYPSIAGNQNSFNPQLVVDELQNILDDDGAFTSVNVRFENISDNTTTRLLYNPTTNATSRAYSLLNYYYWPDGRANRLANLQGAGTAPEDRTWDHVIIMEDPSFIANTPGVYALGVKLLVDTITQGTAQPVLMMQWPHAGSSVPVSDFAEVTYRVGDSGGVAVAPAGFAWNDYTSKDSGTHPTPDGAYLAAATLYHKILGRNASVDSTYTYKNGPTTTALATLANNTVQTHDSLSHYSGAFDREAARAASDKVRAVIRGSAVQSSTEQGFRNYTPYANQRHLYGMLQPQLSLENYDANPSGFSGTQHFYIGRNNPYGSTRYVVQPNNYRTTYAFSFQIRNQDDPGGDGGLEMLYGIDTISGSYRGDQRTAFDLINLNHVSSGVRVLPIHSIWAAAKDELGISSPFYSDGNHYGAAVNEAAVSYLMTHLTGRCPIGNNGTADERTRRTIGYETSWIMSTLNLRPPGFTTQPSSHTAKTVTPGTDETLSVYFVNPPESPVTVDVSLSANTAAIISPKTLTFDGTNHDTIQNVHVVGIPGASSAESFDVRFQSTSSDMNFSDLSDSWGYTNNRAATESLTISEQSDRQEAVTTNVPRMIDLQVLGTTPGNTTLTEPFHGSLSWSGSNVLYTPDTDFIGDDSFAFAVNTGGTLTRGHIEISVSASSATLTVSISPGSISENGGSALATVTRSSDTTDALPVTLVSDDEGEVTVVSGEIPAGQASANFAITAVDDAILDGIQTVTIAASASDHATGSATIDITDDEAAVTYTVSYDGNGSTGGTIPADQTKTMGIALALQGPGDLQRAGYGFSGWNTAADGTGTTYPAGATYSSDADLTLYAQWTMTATTVLVGGSVLNGDFNADPGTSVSFSDTADWFNLMGSQDIECTRDNLDYDGTQNHVAASGKQAALDTGHVIAEGDVFDLAYVWRDAWQWVDETDELLVSLFVTDDNTPTGVRKDLFRDSSGISTLNDTFEAVDHDAIYTAIAEDTGKTLFVVIETNTSAGFARIDNFELTVTAMPADPFDSWIALYDVGGMTGIDDDHDGDGSSNLLEFAFGTNPAEADAGSLAWDGSTVTPGNPVVQQSFPDGGGVDFTVRFIRRRDHGSPGSVSYAWRFSSDLTDWESSDDSPAPGWLQAPTPLGTFTGVDGVTYDLLELNYPFWLDSSKKARFFQVGVGLVL